MNQSHEKPFRCLQLKHLLQQKTVNMKQTYIFKECELPETLIHLNNTFQDGDEQKCIIVILNTLNISENIMVGKEIWNKTYCYSVLFFYWGSRSKYVVNSTFTVHSLVNLYSTLYRDILSVVQSRTFHKKGVCVLEDVKVRDVTTFVQVNFSTKLDSSL